METFEHVVVVVLLPALDLVGGVYPQLLPDCELPLLQGKLVLPPHLAGLLRGLLVGDFGHFEGTVDGANQQLIGLQLLLPGIQFLFLGGQVHRPSIFFPVLADAVPTSVGVAGHVQGLLDFQDPLVQEGLLPLRNLLALQDLLVVLALEGSEVHLVHAGLRLLPLGVLALRGERILRQMSELGIHSHLDGLFGLLGGQALLFSLDFGEGVVGDPGVLSVPLPPDEPKEVRDGCFLYHYHYYYK